MTRFRFRNTNKMVVTLRRWPVFVLISFFLVGCSSQKLILKRGITLDTLRISLVFTPEVPHQIAAELDHQLSDFIIRYNAASKKMRIQQVDGQEISDLQIRVLTSALVTEKQQTAGIVVSVLGLSIPFIMASAGSEFVIFFWYFPKVNSVMELSLDPELNGGAPNPIFVKLSSPGFLKKPERQIAKHGIYFNDYLGRLMNGLQRK